MTTRSRADSNPHAASRQPMPPGIGGGDLAGGPPARRRLATEDEASVQCGGGLPPEPMPSSGLCVELLFLDEDTLECDEERRSSAKGLVASLQRQLGDAGSHVRRKSAFGSLVSRGAFVRVLGHEQISPRHQLPPMQLPLCSASTASWSRSGVVPQHQPLRRDQVEGSAAAPVPKLRLRAAGPLALPADGFGAAFASLFSWMPGCGTPLCAEPTDTVRVRMPEAAPFDSQALEADLGGWPLSLREVQVAFLHASDLRKSVPSVEALPGASPSALPLLGAEAPAEFQRAAIELDEDELVILCPSLLKSVSGGTPSTASTKVSDSWPAPGRLVCPRAGLSRVRGLRTQELEQLQAPTSHVLDFECTSNSGFQFRLLLALPTAKVAARFREATQAPVQPASPTPRPCNGVRCELRISAQLQLNSSRDFQNCAAVVRRGICEATHVSSDRVLVQRIWIEPSGFDAPAQR
eukprot:s111_g63.t1